MGRKGGVAKENKTLGTARRETPRICILKCIEKTLSILYQELIKEFRVYTPQLRIPVSIGNFVH